MVIKSDIWEEDEAFAQQNLADHNNTTTFLKSQVHHATHD